MTAYSGSCHMTVVSVVIINNYIHTVMRSLKRRQLCEARTAEIDVTSKCRMLDRKLVLFYRRLNDSVELSNSIHIAMVMESGILCHRLDTSYSKQPN